MFSPFLHLLNDDFMYPSSMTLLNNGTLFDDDMSLQKMYKERNEFLENINQEIRKRKDTLLKEHEEKYPTQYKRNYSSSKVFHNGNERSEVKDVIEENKDGQKSISQKADTYEKENGEVITDSHVDVQLKQDKEKKNMWTITHQGNDVVLDASQPDFGEKLQALLNKHDSKDGDVAPTALPSPSVKTQKKKRSSGAKKTNKREKKRKSKTLSPSKKTKQ